MRQPSPNRDDAASTPLGGRPLPGGYPCLFRVLREGDTSALVEFRRRARSAAALLADAGLDYFDDLDDPDHVRSRLRGSAVSPDIVLLGAFAPWLVGVIAITRSKHPARRNMAVLHFVHVSPEQRGKGIGRSLLARALIVLRGMSGLSRIETLVPVRDRGTRSLYESLGFHCVWQESLVGRYGHGAIEADRMVLRLSA